MFITFLMMMVWSDDDLLDSGEGPSNCHRRREIAIDGRKAGLKKRGGRTVNPPGYIREAVHHYRFVADNPRFRLMGHPYFGASLDEKITSVSQLRRQVNTPSSYHL